MLLHKMQAKGIVPMDALSGSGTRLVRGGHLLRKAGRDVSPQQPPPHCES